MDHEIQINADKTCTWCSCGWKYTSYTKDYIRVTGQAYIHAKENTPTITEH